MEETIEELAKLTFLKSFLQTPRIENPGLVAMSKLIFTQPIEGVAIWWRSMLQDALC